MREIKIAKSAGFCFGVKRAVNLVYDQVGNAKKVYTYGPIIHNEEVVSDLERKGVHVLSEEDIDAMLAHDGREDDAKEIVIRSHGIGRDAYKKLEQLGFEIVDATCPFVKKIHRIVQEETEQGHCVVIVGDENHPEVCGIRGWCAEFISAKHLNIWGPCGASGPRGGHTVAGVGDHGGTSLFFALCGRFSFKDTKPYETPERRLKWRIAADQREALPKGEVFVLT